jgi:hypothetical protein
LGKDLEDAREAFYQMVFHSREITYEEKFPRYCSATYIWGAMMRQSF